MIFQAEQRFSLSHSLTQTGALEFVRDPALSLAQVRFLQGLDTAAQTVSGELLVQVPVLGQIDLPFRSALELLPDGAALLPQSIAGERAWVEVAGRAHVTPETLDFAFQFTAHLALPESEGWGGAAFEKMVRAAAQRTLERVALALPAGIQAALDELNSREFWIKRQNHVDDG